MNDYESVLYAAAQLSLSDRLRLIDELASSAPEDQPPHLSTEWVVEIERRVAELEAGTATVEDWSDVQKRLSRFLGRDSAS